MDEDQSVGRSGAGDSVRRAPWPGGITRLLLEPLRDLVYPPVCPSCGVLVARHGAVCPPCWQKLIFIEWPFCPVMGTPFSHDMGEAILSAAALADPPVFDRARAALIYNDGARALVTALKYHDRTDLAPTMAAWMHRAGEGWLAASDAIVPVPLHRRRLLSRRFNQAAELARQLAARTGRPLLVGALVRRRPTRQQVGLGAAQRADNVRGAFTVAGARRAEIAGRRLVLVDDVLTTGATVSAATRALKRAGAAEVTVLTFATVSPGHI